MLHNILHPPKLCPKRCMRRRVMLRQRKSHIFINPIGRACHNALMSHDVSGRLSLMVHQLLGFRTQDDRIDAKAFGSLSHPSRTSYPRKMMSGTGTRGGISSRRRPEPLLLQPSMIVASSAMAEFMGTLLLQLLAGSTTIPARAAAAYAGLSKPNAQDHLEDSGAVAIVLC